MTNQLAEKPLLLNKVLFLDGLGRAGKFLLGKVVSNFQAVEYFQYSEVVEHIPILAHLGCIERETAISFLQLNVDINVYNRAVGRNLNLRQSDSSCIGNATDYKDYLQRSSEIDGIEAIEKLRLRKRMPSFLVHECLPHVEFLFDAFPELLMINIQRHPVDIAHSWLLRGWGERFGNDPLAFIPVIQGKQCPVPWFAAAWIDQYEEMSAADRVIKSICTLDTLDKKAYESADRFDQILLICYEDFFSEPQKVVQQIGTFLDSEPFSNMNEILKREGSPRSITTEERKRKYYELEAKSNSKKIMDELICISTQYEKTWKLESFL